MAGHDIDLDAFVNTMGPNAEERMKTVAEDPYAAAKFFHFIIRTMLETLCQIKVTQHQVKSGTGIFGEMTAYFGTVESQGRGTLHLHMLIWLRHVPSTAEMADLLKREEFRAKVCTYIKANIRAYLPGLESAESVKALPKTKNVAYCRPPKPGGADYEKELQVLELKLARVEQVHTCKPVRCLRTDKRGDVYCKRKAPFLIALDDFVTEAGTWGPKRLFPFMNAYCPHILVNMRCNNDIKLLTNGAETKNISFYITSYTTKKQSHHYNTSALLADGYAYHKRYPNEKYLDDLRQSNRLMLFRLVNTVNREQELAGVMVISYLMRWGDTYCSHTYSAIFWSSFLRALFEAYPELSRQEQARQTQASAEPEGSSLEVSTAQEAESSSDVLEDPTGEAVTDMVTLDRGDSGCMFEKSQVTDYCCRGVELQNHNVLSLFVDTYEERIPKVARNRGVEDNAPIAHRGRGRQPHSRFAYLDTHPKFRDLRRVARSPTHRNLPDFVGPWPARSDDNENDEFYCASMLTLLKPWRNIGRDLKNASENWRQAFDRYLASKSEEERLKINRMLSGIQYHHECDSAARAERAAQNQDCERQPQPHNHATGNNGTEHSELEDEDSGLSETQSEAHLKHLWSLPSNEKEHLHAVAAVSIAKHHGIFVRGENAWDPLGSTLSNAVGDDVSKLLRWQKQLSADKARLNGEDDSTAASSAVTECNATVVCAKPSDAVRSTAQVSAVASSSQVDTAVDSAILKDDQYRAYDIMTWHLEQTLAGAEPPPLRMVLYGEGGTGKSKVIQLVTEAFEARGVGNMLVKAAYTGVAASLINGKTTHNIAAMPTSKKLDTKLSDSAKSRLQVYWSQPTYLIIDEFSMISKSFLAILSRNITIGKSGSATFRAGHSFGGINVVLCGDLHQFPPVVAAREEFLFYENSLRRDVNPNCRTRLTGRLIYEEFKTVVVLKQQMRVTDETWREVLVHLRHGEMQTKHIRVLRSLILGRGQGSIQEPDFSKAPWSEASLVTPRHAKIQLQAEHSRWLSDMS
ncbi:hypothetical protein EW026_g7265 [Hermanssonia centrifuga]|uniref:ATP-dependent DNA helicase n=1 Tax=Hermanssonia centrifuga TaxID=98765 RepID=A0A4S4K8E3_9APHY|nr:hypothetical protein EW026_g7265 [Hermanssonia centrifuga]